MEIHLKYIFMEARKSNKSSGSLIKLVIILILLLTSQLSCKKTNSFYKQTIIDSFQIEIPDKFTLLSYENNGFNDFEFSFIIRVSSCEIDSIILQCKKNYNNRFSEIDFNTWAVTKERSKSEIETLIINKQNLTLKYSYGKL
jgi:hypothetical protein